MKAIQIVRTGDPDVLRPVEMDTPSPGPGEVLVKADAIGVNYFDTLIRTGRYRWMPKLPFVPGNEMSGRVEALGPGVRSLATGQRVFVAGYEIGNRGGLYAEYAAVPEAAAWPLPDALDAEEATTLTNYQLAWILLHHAARGIEPKTVVVHGASGGVGSALIDVARAAGATVIGVAGSAEKCAFVHARGAAHALDHRTEPIAERVLALTGGRGADIVFDHIAGRSLIESVKMAAPLGLVVSYAALGGMPDTDLFAAMRGNIEKSPAVRCFTMHTYDHMEKPRREAMRRVIELLTGGGTIRPAIAARFPLAEAHRAHSLIEQRSAMGKIVLKP
ncbi:MAG: zinc-dependent alcohol dehydrogenase family protein [Rhizobiales bacterium]|jgi:NADPH2:quinone reductase|nr:zinc-dependent alcohol dehydrogenase family protein [Hyphomicrobiales bacterium]